MIIPGKSENIFGQKVIIFANFWFEEDILSQVAYI